MPDFSEILYRMEIVPSNSQLPKAVTVNERNENALAVNRIDVKFVAQRTDLKFESTADQIRHGKVDVMLVVYDRYGNPTNWSTKTFDLALSPEGYAAALQSGIQLNLEVGTSKESSYLRSGIYDLQSQKVGTLEIPLSDVTRASSERISAIAGKNLISESLRPSIPSHPRQLVKHYAF